MREFIIDHLKIKYKRLDDKQNENEKVPVEMRMIN